MVRILKSDERGQADHGWLKSKHTFSFADYFNPSMHHFRSLRVINEDWVEPSKGFATHPHNNMEIITYVLSGELAHKDSMGNGSVIRSGEVQYMSAGSGVTHSEFNHSDKTTVHLLQIWIFPDKKNTPPRYDQKAFSDAKRKAGWTLVASKDGRDGSIAILQDANMYATLLDGGVTRSHEVRSGRGAYLHVATGPGVKLGDQELRAGDAAMIEDAQTLDLTGLGSGTTNMILFDLAN